MGCLFKKREELESVGDELEYVWKKNNRSVWKKQYQLEDHSPFCSATAGLSTGKRTTTSVMSSHELHSWIQRP